MAKVVNSITGGFPEHLLEMKIKKILNNLYKKERARYNSARPL